MSDRWQAFLDYGALFQPLAGGEPVDQSQSPLSMADIAPLRALTERYGTGTSLAWALLQRGSLDRAVRSYAELALLYGRSKAERQLQGLKALVGTMNESGVVPLLLKGSAAQAAGLYPDPGFRLMADIDLLVAEQELARAVQAAEQVGFAVVPESRVQESHALQLFSTEFGLLLEVHHRLARTYERDNFPAARVLAAAQEAEFRGGRVLLPDWSQHAALTILHAMAWDRSRYMALVPWKALLDLAALKASGANLCWQGVERELADAGETATLVHCEVLFAALFGTPLTGIPVTAARRRRIELYYARGARRPMLHRIGLFRTGLRKRLMRARHDPGRLRKLLSPAFYGRVVADSRKSFRSDAPLS